MAPSPALFSGYLGLSGTLAKSVLPVAVREQLALTVLTNYFNTAAAVEIDVPVVQA